MFERFTDDARQVVVLAQEESRQLRASRIEPAHLLLALARVPGPGRDTLAAAGLDDERLRTTLRTTGTALDADALAALGIDLDQVRAAAEASFGPGALDGQGPVGSVRFAPGSKRALQLSVRLAGRLFPKAIDTGCLLHGVLSAGDPTVEQVLRQLGSDPAVLRQRLGEDGQVA